MQKKDWFIISGLVLFYLLILLFFKRDIFFYKFDTQLIERYNRSQDITHEVKGVRLFLSDSDVYMATGYLYAHGSDPSLNNFEHPPLIKYLFGFSILLFNNPYLAQIMIGILVLGVFYFLSKKVSNSTVVSTLACLFLICDPLFIDVSSQTLLDLGQILFLLLYFLSFFYYRKNFILQGIFLGLFAGTKFWIPTFFFIGLFGVYRIYKKNMNYRDFFAHLGIAFLTYTLLYTQTFILREGNFNIIWHFLKTIKYRIQHNSSLYLGASLIMYVTSYVKTWWGNQEIVSTRPWSILWPVSLIVTLWRSYVLIMKKKIDEEFLIAIIPIGYLFFLGVQAPFSRYFLPILPFSYLVVAKVLKEKAFKWKKGAPAIKLRRPDY